METTFQATKEKKRLYGGIDLHKSSSVINLMDEHEKRVTSRSIQTDHESFKRFFAPFLENYQVEVAIEAGNLTFWLCDILHLMGIETYVVNPLLNKAIAESSRKTDKRDARTLALQLKKGMLPNRVYEPPVGDRELRSIVKHREQLVKDRSRTANRAYALLTRAGKFVSRQDLSKYARYWEMILEKESIDPESILYFEFQSYMQQYMLLSGQISELEKRIKQKCMELNPEYYELLIQHPGVGPATTSVVIAYCNGVERFINCRKFACYTGLVPEVRESGGKKSYSMNITRQGISILRAYLTQASLGVMKSSHPDARPLKEWYNRVKVKKGWRKARIALARKIATTIFGVLKNKTKFNPALVMQNS
jgi:transposase